MCTFKIPLSNFASFSERSPAKVLAFPNVKCSIKKLYINGVVVTNPEGIANQLNFTFHGELTDPLCVSSRSTLLSPCAIVPYLLSAVREFSTFRWKLELKGTWSWWLAKCLSALIRGGYFRVYLQNFNASHDEASVPIDWPCLLRLYQYSRHGISCPLRNGGQFLLSTHAANYWNTLSLAMYLII